MHALNTSSLLCFASAPLNRSCCAANGISTSGSEMETVSGSFSKSWVSSVDPHLPVLDRRIRLKSMWALRSSAVSRIRRMKYFRGTLFQDLKCTIYYCLLVSLLCDFEILCIRRKSLMCTLPEWASCSGWTDWCRRKAPLSACVRPRRTLRTRLCRGLWTSGWSGARTPRSGAHSSHVWK